MGDKPYFGKDSQSYPCGGQGGGVYFGTECVPTVKQPRGRGEYQN